jgi:hypothetical protein
MKPVVMGFETFSGGRVKEGFKRLEEKSSFAFDLLLMIVTPCPCHRCAL